MTACIVGWAHTPFGKLDGETADAGTDAQITDGSANPAAISNEGHRLQIEDMMRAVLDDRPPMIDGREGRRSLELVAALYQSAARRQPVSL